MASGEVRGGAPASCEFDLLDPGRTVSTHRRPRAHRRLGVRAGGGRRRRAVGARSGAGASPPRRRPVPIVVACRSSTWASATLGASDGREGYAAALAARRRRSTWPAAVGRRGGAGTGATVARGGAGPRQRPGGLVSAGARWATSGWRRWWRSTPPACRAATRAAVARPPAWAAGGLGAGGNTTIGLVATNARIDKAGLPPGGPGRPRRPGPGGVPGPHARRRRRLRGRPGATGRGGRRPDVVRAAGRVHVVGGPGTPAWHRPASPIGRLGPACRDQPPGRRCARRRSRVRSTAAALVAVTRSWTSRGLAAALADLAAPATSCCWRATWGRARRPSPRASGGASG